MIVYREVTKDGRSYLLPQNISTGDSRKARFWIAWQERGLPVPDPVTGRCGIIPWTPRKLPGAAVGD